MRPCSTAFVGCLLGYAGALLASCSTAGPTEPMAPGEASSASPDAEKPRAVGAGTAMSSGPRNGQPAPGPCASGAAIDPASVGDGVRGSFSAAGRDEMVGSVPCPGQAGNVALLRKGDGGWTILRLSEVDGRIQRIGCRAVRTASGRDLLVCREVLNVGSVREESLAAYDYGRPGHDEREELFAATDTTAAACTGAREVASVSLGDLVTVDVDGDGDLDVRATLRAGKVRVPGSPHCDALGMGTGAPPRLAEPRPRVLELALEGERLVPTASTARLIASLEAELPEP